MTNEKKWFDDLPKPKSTPQQVSVSELSQLIADNAQVVVVDVRRADIETFFQTLPALIPMLKPSQGRGPRCAAWYQDRLEEQGLRVNSFVLTGGIKAWVEAYPEDVIRI